MLKAKGSRLTHSPKCRSTFHSKPPKDNGKVLGGFLQAFEPVTFAVMLECRIHGLIATGSWTRVVKSRNCGRGAAQL